MSWTTIAAVVVFTGCGGGSGKKTGTRVVSAKSRTFRTVVPLGGFTYNASQAQYAVEGNGVRGGILLVVIREPVERVGGIDALARRSLRAARHERGIHQVSGPSALSVGGDPALAMDYSSREKAGESQLHQIFVRHGKWVYVIREAWPTVQQAAASGALEEVLSHWQWQ